MGVPTSITDGYNIEALIHHSDRTETYRLSGKTDEKKYLMKVRPIAEKDITDTEEFTLKKLERNIINGTKVVLRLDTDTHCYLIRDYIDGVTLETYAENIGYIREEDILYIGISLCEELQHLHALSDSIIHRDIKPKNILLTNHDLFRQGHFSSGRLPQISLIDFDTARTFKENASTDTQFLGTKETAAPEQYGFAQSDVRTDIFGVGKTLIYLATGTYDAGNLDSYNYSKRFRQLLLSCVSLNKEDRPESALALSHSMKRILNKDAARRAFLKMMPGKYDYDGSHIDGNSQKHASKRVASIVAVLISAVIFGVGGFLLGRITDDVGTKEISSLPVATSLLTSKEEVSSTPSPTHAPGDIVDFGGSKSLELAVRTSLGYKKTQKVTYGDLAKIETLFAIGDNSFSNADSYRNTDNEDQLLHDRATYQEVETVFVEPGDISDISLLSEMPNLKKVYFSHQSFSDISPLAGLDLEDLAIYDCPIADYTPIKNKANLSRLVLMGCKGADLTFLPDLPSLEELCIGRMNLTTLRFLEDLTISDLQFEKCFADDRSYDAIGKISTLTTLTLWNTTEEIIRTIGGSSTVQRLEIYWTSMPGGLTAIGEMPSLRSLALNCATPASMDGIEKMHLNYIFPPGNVGLDWLLNCPSIDEMETTSIKNVDWKLIDRSGIKIVYAPKKQQKEIKKVLKNPSFEVRDV